MNKLAGFDAKSSRGFFQLCLDGSMRPLRKIFESFTQGLQALERSGLSERLFQRALLKRIVLREQKTDPIRDVAKMFDLRFDNSERTQQRVTRRIGEASPLHKREGELTKPLQAHLQDILTVQPKTLVQIENRIPPVNGLKLEKLEDLFRGQHLAVIFGRPTEQTEIIAEGFWGVTGLHKVGHARSSVAFAKLLAFVI